MNRIGATLFFVVGIFFVNSAVAEANCDIKMIRHDAFISMAKGVGIGEDLAKKLHEALEAKRDKFEQMLREKYKIPADKSKKDMMVMMLHHIGVPNAEAVIDNAHEAMCNMIMK